MNNRWDDYGPCKYCGLCATEFVANGKLAVDPCLGLLPGVAHACCGHRDFSDSHSTGPYVVIGGKPNQSCTELLGRVELWGEDALEYFRNLGVGPVREPDTIGTT